MWVVPSVEALLPQASAQGNPVQLVMPSSEACLNPRENESGLILSVDGAHAATTSTEAERAKAWACKTCSEGFVMAVLLPLNLQFPEGVDSVSCLQSHLPSVISSLGLLEKFVHAFIELTCCCKRNCSTTGVMRLSLLH
jgi:hypothetical protein